MKTLRHQMGVEGPSFYEYQQKKKAGENPVPPAGPPRKKSMFETIFGAPLEEKATGPAVTPPPTHESRMRPGYQRRGMSFVDPNQWFAVPEIWNYVHETRSQFRGQTFIVTVLTQPAAELKQAAVEVIQFFGIPLSAYEGLTIEQTWQNVIGPFFDDIESAINQMKPFTVPGSIRFDMVDGSLVLVYQDR